MSELRRLPAFFSHMPGPDNPPAIEPGPDPDPDIAWIQLRIPRDRLECASWISTQPPPVVARALELSESALASLDASLSRGGAREAIERLSNQHREEIEEARAAMAAELRALKAANKQIDDERLELIQTMHHRIQTAAEQHRAEVLESHEKDKEELARQHQTELMNLEVSLGEKVKSLTTQLEHERTVNGDTKERLREQVQQERDAAQRRYDSLHEQAQTRIQDVTEFSHKLEQQLDQARTQLDQTMKQKDTLAHQVSSESREMREMMQSWSGSQTKGVVGERFVDEVFSELEIGSRSNVSKVQRPGFADRFWEYDFPDSGTPGIRAMMEAKNSLELHSKNDIDKFYRDIKSGVDQNRINCAVLISLKSRIQGLQGTKQIDLTFMEGIPVLRASRGPNDAISPLAIVKMAFLTVVNMWPYLSANKSKNEDTVVHAVSEYLDAQLGSIQSMQREINLLDKSIGGLQKQVGRMRRVQGDMLQGLQSVKLQHPQLIKNVAHDQGDRIELLDALEAAVVSFREREQNTQGHYPKTGEELQLPDELRPRVDKAAFDEAVKRVRKKEAKVKREKGKKRKSPGTDHDETHETHETHETYKTHETC